MLDKIISGGQTGADQAAWRAAEAFGVPTGGWMPEGFLTEDGPRPEFAERYGAAELPRETATPPGPNRTSRTPTRPSGSARRRPRPPRRRSRRVTGSASRACRSTRARRSSRRTSRLDRGKQIKTLNVAGNREAEEPGIGDRVNDLRRGPATRGRASLDGADGARSPSRWPFVASGGWFGDAALSQRPACRDHCPPLAGSMTRRPLPAPSKCFELVPAGLGLDLPRCGILRMPSDRERLRMRHRRCRPRCFAETHRPASTAPRCRDSRRDRTIPPGRRRAALPPIHPLSTATASLSIPCVRASIRLGSIPASTNHRLARVSVLT